MSQTEYNCDAVEASGSEDLAGKLTAIRDKFLLPTPDKDFTDYAIITRCIAALLSARPLALGGQQGEGWRCPDCGAQADEWFDCCKNPAQAQSDDLRTACQAVLDDYQTSDTHHPDHILIRRTDFDRIKALVEAPVVAQAEAQDEGAAGEAVAWQRRLRNTQAEPGHPFAEWSSWKECDAEKVAYHNDTGGRVFGFPELKSEVRPLYAHPSPTPAADADRVRETMQEAIDLIAHLKPEKARFKLEQALADLKSTAAKEGGE